MGKDEFEKLVATLDFKDTLIKEMNVKNRFLQREVVKEREQSAAIQEEMQHLQQELQMYMRMVEQAENRAHIADSQRAHAAQERDTAVALAMQTQQHAETEMSKQQVAWDLGKQHALQVMMDVRRNNAKNMLAASNQSHPLSPGSSIGGGDGRASKSIVRKVVT